LARSSTDKLVPQRAKVGGESRLKNVPQRISAAALSVAEHTARLSGQTNTNLSKAIDFLCSSLAISAIFSNL
jgi:hypothetical protein